MNVWKLLKLGLISGQFNTNFPLSRENKLPFLEAIGLIVCPIRNSNNASGPGFSKDGKVCSRVSQILNIVFLS